MGVQSRERVCKGKKAQKKRKKERFSALQRPQARGFKGILGP